jgi:hypothetical protein
MAKILRIGLKTVLWVLAVVAIAVVAVFAINAFDEDIWPETTALLKGAPNPYASDENLYLALVGFDAPNGQSVFSFGEARVAESDADAASLLKNPQGGPAILAHIQDRDKDPHTIQFRGKTGFCQPLGSCWTGVENHQPEVTTLLKDNAELYRRYLALHTLRGYFETGTPNYLMRWAYVPSDVRAMFLADTALRIKTGKTVQAQQSALADLGRDVATWRQMLTGYGGLISKLMAVANLHGDYVLLGDMIADPAIDLAPLATAIDGILLQVAVDDWKLHGVFGYEFRISAGMYEQIQTMTANAYAGYAPNGKELAWWQQGTAHIEGHFWKANATENTRALVMINLQQMADSDPSKLLAAQEALARWAHAKFGFRPSFLYNPVGKTIAEYGITSYNVYPLRAFDIAAYSRGVRLAYEIRMRRIPTSEIPAFMGQHPEWSTHPVSGEAFAWRQQAHELRIQPVGGVRTDRRFDIPIWRASTAPAKS